MSGHPAFGAPPSDRSAISPGGHPGSPIEFPVGVPVELSLRISSFDGATPREHREIAVADSGERIVQLGRASWRIGFVARAAGEGTVDAAATFVLDSGDEPCGNVSMALRLRRWAQPDYLLVPAAVYAGNRFRVHATRYPPYIHTHEGAGPDMDTVITDVPRLEAREGKSGFHLRSGDMSTPCVGIYSGASSRGLLVLFEPVAGSSLTGLEVTESPDRASLRIAVEAPAVREHMYRMVDSKAETEDRGARYSAGDSVTLRARIRSFPCADVPALFDAFFDARKELVSSSGPEHALPLSAAFRIIEGKYNRSQWNGTGRYYRVGPGDSPYEDWQAGWVGGGMSSLPLLQSGSALSRERARATMDSVFGFATPSGFVRPMVSHGVAMGDDFCHKERTAVSLVRKQVDVLLFAARHVLLLRRRGEEIPEAWLAGVRGLARALGRLWKRWGQLGQFVDIEREEILAGGTASGAIAPAGLALAARVLGEHEHLEVAQAIARFMEERHVRTGFCNGGPGEILQNADSESAFGMLESFVVLYEETGDRAWLPGAEDAARQCASWCVSYDFPFPADSAFGRLGMRTLGSVWANVQNKHSAPGICTLSPLSLLKLHRATGDRRYLELAREIAHNVTQYLSREDRPIPTWDGRVLPPGWMCERVNTSDWEGGRCVGGVFYGSCWCEVSCLLTYTEVPGVWFLADTGEAVVFDHVEVSAADSAADSAAAGAPDSVGGGDAADSAEPAWRLELRNPTAFEADVSILVDRRGLFERPLGECVVEGCLHVTVPAHGRAEVRVASSRAARASGGI